MKCVHSYVWKKKKIIYGVCCSDVIPAKEKSIEKELRRPEDDDDGGGDVGWVGEVGDVQVEPLYDDGIDHSEVGLVGLWRREGGLPFPHGVPHNEWKPKLEVTFFTINYFFFFENPTRIPT